MCKSGVEKMISKVKSQSENGKRQNKVQVRTSNCQYDDSLIHSQHCDGYFGDHGGYGRDLT